MPAQKKVEDHSAVLKKPGVRTTSAKNKKRWGVERRTPRGPVGQMGLVEAGERGPLARLGPHRLS